MMHLGVLAAAGARSPHNIAAVKGMPCPTSSDLAGPVFGLTLIAFYLPIHL